MSLARATAAEAAADLSRFDAVIDVRSPSEFAEDHLPGAINLPVLDDDERREVGTLYKQVSALRARQVGAVIVARRIAEHLAGPLSDRPRDWRPLVYCWRGGQRSGSLAWFLSQVGYRTTQLDGGYKAFRALVRETLATCPSTLPFVVLAGRTGSGKTRLLQRLAARGAQVLDLEGLASHRGSVLGAVPGRPQPSQKAFDTAVWQALQRFDPARPVFVESESARIGRLRVPPALIERLHAAATVRRVEMPLAARVALLLEDYRHFVESPESLCRQLDALVELRGRERVEGWQALALAGAWSTLYERLMVEHYDPLYERSMQRHYARLADAPRLPLADGGAAALDAACDALLDGAGDLAVADPATGGDALRADPPRAADRHRVAP